jgi:hypothetical protein
MSTTSFAVTLLVCMCLLVLDCNGLVYRLINGNNTAGILQAATSSSSSSPRGTVCGSFNDAAATVACSSIGLSGYVGRVVPASLFGIGYGPIMMSNVNCGSLLSSTLDVCQYTNQSSTVCGHDSDVAISCSLPQQPGVSFMLLNGTFGKIMYRNASTLPWSPVCGYSSMLANAACRGLDTHLYGSASSYSSTAVAAGDTVMVPVCSSLPNVTLDRCLSSFGAAACTGMTINSCGRVAYAARLVNMSDDFTGLLEVRPGDGFAWGTVCNQGITGFNPTVLCRVAGHPGTIGTIISRPATYATEPATKPMYFSSLSCPSNTTSSTSQCTFSTDVSGCTHDMDVYLRCSVVTIPDAASWEFAQAPSSSSYKPLLVRPNASAPWGVVCRSLSGFGALAACKSVGFPFTTNAYYTTVTLQSVGGLSGYMYNTECDVNARNLTQCMFTTSSTSSCSSAVALLCYLPSFSYQLTSGTLAPRSEYGGLLEVMPSSSQVGWGNVCNDGTFSAANATMMCNSFFGGRVGVVTGRYGGSYVNRTLLSKLNCSGATSLGLCRMTQPESPCPSVVGIDCVVPTTQQNTFEFSVASAPSNTYQPVLMRPNASAAWLPICYGWYPTSITALALCRQLGYPANYGYASSSSFDTTKDRYQISAPSCATASTPLQNCVQDSTELSQVSSSTCGSVLVVYCSTSYQGGYFLSGPKATSGLLQTTLDSEPGTVCSLPSFSGNAPNVACATLGFAGYTGALRFVGAGSGPVIESALSCPYANMTTLSACVSSAATGACTHQNDVGLYCAVPTLTSASRLEVMIDEYSSAVLVRKSAANAWAAVCYDTLASSNRGATARAVCASVGLANYSSSWSSTSSDPTMGNGGPTLYDVVCADVYNITNLGQCLYTTDAPISGCSRFLSVYCYTTSWDYKLFGGADAYSGTVAVRPSSYAPWGSVCGKGATPLVATYLCHMVGLEGYEGKVTASLGAASGPVYQSNFSCIAGEGTPTCSYNGTSANGCTGADAITIACTKPTPRLNWAYSLPSFGSRYAEPLMLRPSNAAAWGYVGYGSSQSASLACRSVNPNVPTYASSSWTTVATGSVVYLTMWGCAEDATSIGDCLANTTSYTTTWSTNVLSIACYYEAFAWDVRMLNPQSGISNSILGIAVTSGLLQVRPSSDAPWGTVCGSSFQQAGTICSQALGSLGYGLVGQFTTRFGAGSGPIYMSGVSCGSSATRIGDCTYTNQTATAGAGGCSHSNDVGIECVVPPARTAWSYEPESGCDPRTNYCPVIARQSGQTNLSKVCYYASSTDPQFQSITSGAAKAICNSFGLGDGSYAYYTVDVDSSTSEGRVALSCGSNTTEVGTAQRCLQISVSSCRYGYVLSVYCGGSNLMYRLANTRNASNEVAGTLVVTSSGGRQGGVCASGIDSATATIACNTVGLSGMVGRVNAIAASSTGLPVMLDSVNCSAVSGEYITLPQCATRASTGACTSVAEIVCSVPSTTWSLQPQWSTGSYNTLYVRPNASSAWGFVCDQSSYQVSPLTATMVCNTLFPTNADQWGGWASSSYLYYNELSVTPVYASSVDCSINASSFSNCVVRPYVASSSPCRYVASVACYVSMLKFDFRLRRSDASQIGVAADNNVSYGVVELRPKSMSANGSAWGTLCNSRRLSVMSADNMCSLLGFPNSVGAVAACPAGAAAQSFGMTIYARDLSCEYLGDCTGQPHGYQRQTNGDCTHVNDTCIVCNPVAALPGAGGLVLPGRSSSATWSAALEADAYDGEPPLLYVRPNASMAWGHVCNGTTFGASEARMFCRWLGCLVLCILHSYQLAG